MEKARKQEIIKEFGRSEHDTGSAEVQIALLKSLENFVNNLKGGSLWGTHLVQ